MIIIKVKISKPLLFNCQVHPKHNIPFSRKNPPSQVIMCFYSLYLVFIQDSSFHINFSNPDRPFLCFPLPRNLAPCVIDTTKLDTNNQHLPDFPWLEPQLHLPFCSDPSDPFQLSPLRSATSKSRNSLFSRERIVQSLPTCRSTSPSSHGCCPVFTESPVLPCLVLFTP